MVSSSIVVGRVLVDPEHADIARSLLSAEDIFAHTEPIVDSKEKDDATKADEDYARKLQEEFIQDTLRAMEDYRYAKSLAERDEGYSFTFNQPATDYLRDLLTTGQSLDHELLVQKNEDPDWMEFEPGDDIDIDTAGDDSDSILNDHSVSPCRATAAVAEQRRASLALAINAGLPGPSGLIQRTASTNLEEWLQRVSSSASSVYSRSSTDPGDPDHVDIRYERYDMDDTNASKSDDEEKAEINDFEERDTRGIGDSHKDNIDEMGDENRCELDITQVLGDQFGFRTVFCMPCGDLVVAEPTLQAPCGHDICVDCVQDLVTTATRDESLFPPSCCRQPISQTALSPFLTVGLQAIYDVKRTEFATPADERIFCPNPTCSVFLGSSQGGRETITCTRCKSVVCASCGQVAHPGDSCTENTSNLAVKKLAKEQHWQTCPKCHAIVERTVGCNHMVCRCSSNFCYGCGGLMGQCKC